MSSTLQSLRSQRDDLRAEIEADSGELMRLEAEYQALKAQKLKLRELRQTLTSANEVVSSCAVTMGTLRKLADQLEAASVLFDEADQAGP